MYYAFLSLLLMVALILGWEIWKRGQARRFAARHGLRAVRGSIDSFTPLIGEIRGVRVQFDPERVNVGNRGRESRVVVTLESTVRDIGVLQRWKTGWIELSVQAPAGLQRIELSSALREEYELWGSSTRQKPWAWLEKPKIVGLLVGFRSLRRVQCLGTSVVMYIRGDLGDVQAMERAWSLLDEITSKA